MIIFVHRNSNQIFPINITHNHNPPTHIHTHTHDKQLFNFSKSINQKRKFKKLDSKAQQLNKNRKIKVKKVNFINVKSDSKEDDKAFLKKTNEKKICTKKMNEKKRNNGEERNELLEMLKYKQKIAISKKFSLLFCLINYLLWINGIYLFNFQ